MKQLMLNPTIYKYENCKTFCREFRIGKDDLIITNKKIYNNYLKYNVNEAAVLFKESYGDGEPSDEMVEAMYENIKRVSYERVIAIGGGSILDIGKVFSLRYISSIKDLYEHKCEIIKDKELVLVPTTCGTGSEINNISILELKEEKVKIEISTDEFYADSVAIIPELLQSLPFEVFIYSSTVALVHAIESYLSPQSSTYTKMFSLNSIEMIITGYKKIVAEGRKKINGMLNNFLLASNYSGIAYANSGYSKIHEMSCKLSSICNMSYGEASYTVFIKMFEVYQKESPNRELKELNKFLANLLKCAEDGVYEKVEGLLDNLITMELLIEHRVNEKDLDELAKSTSSATC